ncbi:MAG: 5-oxoprolinase subunit PxpA [Acidimicrobiales bacterium]
MAAVDLNADLGEGETLLPSDLAILDCVTSANLSCGFHAGNATVMRDCAEAAIGRGVVIGAHVSYRDRPGFGRRPLDVPADQLMADIVEQYGVLDAVVRSAGGSLSYIKPHGALYHRMGEEDAVAAVVTGAARECGCGILLAQAGTGVADPERGADVAVFGEAFADRSYLPTGKLVPRHRPDAVIHDPASVAQRALSLVTEGGIETVDGSWLALRFESLCVHGDTPTASASARAVRAALDAAQVVVRPFAGPP